MHIKMKLSYAIFMAAGALIFFGYIAYQDLIYDASVAAQDKVVTKVASVEKEESFQPTAEYYGLKRAEIAIQEYRKNVIEQPLGCNCGPEIEKYTEGVHAQWCTMFASWVGKEAGSGVYNEKIRSWKIVNSRDFALYLQEHGAWYSREEVIKSGVEPRVGDYIVYWRGNFEDNLGHVDVVVDIDDKPGHADLVGGNLLDRVEYRDNFPYLNNYGFLGFGRPEKE